MHISQCYSQHQVHFDRDSSRKATWSYICELCIINRQCDPWKWQSILFQFCFKYERKWRIRRGFESNSQYCHWECLRHVQTITTRTRPNRFRVPITRDLIKKRLINVTRSTTQLITSQDVIRRYWWLAWSLVNPSTCLSFYIVQHFLCLEIKF